MFLVADLLVLPMRLRLERPDDFDMDGRKFVTERSDRALGTLAEALRSNALAPDCEN